MTGICHVDWPGFFSSLKDVVLAISAAGTAFAAIRGLNTWRVQRVGNVQIDAALKLVRAAVATRDALKSARSPMLWTNEFPDGYKGIDAQEQSRGTSYALQNRWNSVQQARGDLEAARVECEAIWGQKVGEAVRDMYVVTNEWIFAAQYHVRSIANPNPSQRQRQTDQEKEAILFRYTADEDDFGERIDQVFNDIESAVLPALEEFRKK